MQPGHTLSSGVDLQHVAMAAIAPTKSTRSHAVRDGVIRDRLMSRSSLYVSAHHAMNAGVSQFVPSVLDAGR